MNIRLFGIAFLCACSCASADLVRVIIMGGQSNMDGRANMTASPVTMPVALGTSSGGAVSTVLSSSVLTGTSTSGQTGPEVGLASCLASQHQRFALVKYATGGSSLQTDWMAGGDSTGSGDGTEYSNLQKTVSDAMSLLQASNPMDTFAISGFVWTQGEKDARNGRTESEYSSDLAAFIDDVRMTYGSDLPFHLSRLSANQTDLPSSGLQGIRSAQEAVAASDPHVSIIDTDSFGMKPDALHFNASGQLSLGNGFCDSVVSSAAVPEANQLIGVCAVALLVVVASWAKI